jgi:hypothetical protein
MLLSNFQVKAIMKITMKKLSILLTIIMSSVAFSCKDFEELEKDPNRPTSVDQSLIFNGVLNDLADFTWNDVMRWNQFYCSNYNYYANNEYTWTSNSWNYTTLKNVGKMEEETLKRGAEPVNPYSALAKFFRAYFFVKMSTRVGDIPVDEALLGLENTKPKYNTQKEVYVRSLQLLEESNNDLASLISKGDNTLSGDIFSTNNNLRAWQKVVNTFKLRVLISLSKKELDGDLAIKQKFSEVVNNPTKYPLMTSNADNLSYVYNAAFNKYGRNKDNFGFNALRENMAATYMNPLVDLKDPRIFVVAEPTPEKVKAGAVLSDFSSFAGARSDEDLSDMSTKAQQGKYSFQNRKRYYDGYTAENTIQIGYPELCFNIAEAYNRGWVSGKTVVDAEAWYKNGILASMDFYGIKTGTMTATYLKEGDALGTYQSYSVSVDIDAYYNQAKVKYEGNTAGGLSQILTQKYLAFFQNSGWEAFYNQRRTGVPVFFKDQAGNGNGSRIPKRWNYPTAEGQYNTVNYNAALTAQFGTNKEDINTDLWINK